jgi:hypothetical protein
MLLHAWRVGLPAELAGAEFSKQGRDDAVFSVLPAWPEAFMPRADELACALEELHRALKP